MSDYGVRPLRRRLAPKVLLGAALLASGVIAFGTAGVTYLKDRRTAIATAGDWRIDGPPCPTFSKAQFDSFSRRAPKTIEYDGMTVVRQNGHIMCTAVTNGGGKGFGSFPVCQMTAPQAVHVVTGKGEAYFVPGFGRPATVSAPGGAPTCVMASKFTLQG
jgi:hypothetical protein